MGSCLLQRRNSQRGRASADASCSSRSHHVIYISNLATDHLFLLAVGSGNRIKVRFERRLCSGGRCWPPSGLGFDGDEYIRGVLARHGLR